MMELFEPLRAGGADVYVYREPWTVEGISEACAQAVDKIAAPLLADGPLDGASAVFTPCLSAQQTINDYRSTVDEVVRGLTARYRKVHIVGFSFGATRLRYVLSSLTPGISVDFIEPGPHPGSALKSWAGDRVRTAMRLMGDRCRGGDTTACQVTGIARTTPTAGRRARELAALYSASHPEVTGRSVAELARLSLSVNADGEIQSPGIGFLAGMCLQVDASVSGDDVYSHLIELCPTRGAPEMIDGGASACVRVNPAEPLVGAMDGWSDDPGVSEFQQIAGTPFHGALLGDLLDQQRIECPA